MHSLYNSGFDVVLYGAVIYIARQRVTLSHCPLLDTYREDTTGMRGSVEGEPWHGNNRPKHRLSSFLNEGQFHAHGHIHSRKGKTVAKKILGRQLDVGVPANNYTPVSWSQFESFIMKTLQKEKEELILTEGASS
jgi:calcineurin-like phosphoesterase family protein